jgi:CBS-domain-containing membrane protein
MTITELMTRDPAACRGDDLLQTAAQIMWDRDCGSVPVVDDDGQVVGMITDRDLCMAAYLRGQALHECAVHEVMGRPAIVCRDQDSVDTALEAMRQHRIRRVPIVDGEGRLTGLLSLNDLALAASGQSAQRRGMQPEAVSATLTAICQHRTADAQAA